MGRQKYISISHGFPATDGPSLLGNAAAVYSLGPETRGLVHDRALRREKSAGHFPWERRHPGGMPYERRHPGGMSYERRHPGGMSWERRHPGGMSWERRHPGGMSWERRHPGGMSWERSHPGGMSWERRHPGGMPWERRHPGGIFFHTPAGKQFAQDGGPSLFKSHKGRYCESRNISEKLSVILQSLIYT